VAFSNGAAHSIEEGAIIQEIAALHVKVTAPPTSQPSVSTQIGLLRQILLSSDDSKITSWFRKVAQGELPLVAHVNNADVIAKLLSLKSEVEEKTGTPLKLAFFGGLESHLLAAEIASAGVGVIVAPSRSFPDSWGSQRILPGPPLTEDTLISTLLAHNVTVGIGIEEAWMARNTRFDVAWAAFESVDRITKSKALALASTNLEKIFGIPSSAKRSEWVAYRGGDVFDFGSKVVGVVSRTRKRVDLF